MAEEKNYRDDLKSYSPVIDWLKKAVYWGGGIITVVVLWDLWTATKAPKSFAERREVRSAIEAGLPETVQDFRVDRNWQQKILVGKIANYEFNMLQTGVIGQVVVNNDFSRAYDFAIGTDIDLGSQQVTSLSFRLRPDQEVIAAPMYLRVIRRQ
ncbi:MAG: hypothetical protein HZA80_01775 [Candidatus Taylorbacteria bacterium]|nr:hypothetical protein [Candidatus Taylorbacteria bacterium]